MYFKFLQFEQQNNILHDLDIRIELKERGMRKKI